MKKLFNVANDAFHAPSHDTDTVRFALDQTGDTNVTHVMLSIDRDLLALLASDDYETVTGVLSALRDLHAKVQA